MNFNKHLELVGQHAFLGASKYHWINYDEDRLIEAYSNAKAVQRGTELHAFACQAIRLGIPLKTKDTLGLYVNDAIGFKMIPEQVLCYSYNCFGTADSVSFRRKFLRIHDLKTGESAGHFEQLKVYEAIFCLEYGHKPSEIESELRIYQYDDFTYQRPSPEEIEDIMAKIVSFDKRIELLKLEV